MADWDGMVVQVMDQATYLEDEKQELFKAKQLSKKIYLQQIEDSLQRVHKSDSEANNLAQNMLSEGVELYFNASTDDANLLKANSLSEEYRDIIYDRYFMLISAPTKNLESGLDFRDETDARHYQFNNFLDSHYGVKHEPDMNPVYRTTCFTYPEMISEIQKFLLKTATAANMANIIFNGHGNSLGLLLHSEGSPVNLDNVIDDVESIVCQRKLSKAGPPIPYLVQLVFAQCYAHTRQKQDSKNPDLNVISFTTPEKPTTTMTVKRRKAVSKGFTVRVVVDSHHQELDKHAERDTLPIPGKVAPPTGALEGPVVTNPTLDDVDMMDTS